jgi:acyl carrier protein phosphodiesterase
MNYLAHAYFSFKHEEIMVGNLISDFVKGKKKFDYPTNIQKGITLHRSIDTFTDEHPVTKEAKEFLRPAVGLYSGAFIDVAYDHFLANDSKNWNQNSLQQFASNVYDNLENNYQILPAKLQQMLPYMKAQNWLYNYQFRWGIEKSFQGIVKRAVYLNSADQAFEMFNKHYNSIENLSQIFLADVKKFAAHQFSELLKA